MSNAHEVARKEALRLGADVSDGQVENHEPNPLYWRFAMANDRSDRVGGYVMVDRLDGHIWTCEEYENYMYDYNNVFS